jgi:lysophospholipase L1-like esterase
MLPEPLSNLVGTRSTASPKIGPRAVPARSGNFLLAALEPYKSLSQRSESDSFSPQFAIFNTQYLIFNFLGSARRIFLLLALLFLLPLHTFAASSHWVGTWACGPQLTEHSASQNNLPPAPLAYSTLRQFVHTTISGQHLRVRFSNAYGTNSVTMNSVHIALAAGTGSLTNAVINTSTDTALTFHGAPSITIPAGDVVWSDPCSFNLPTLTNLAISIYYGYVSTNAVPQGTITGHPGSRTTSSIQAGNVVSASSMPSAATTAHWYTITGVDVLADTSSKAVATLGDSITDGRGSTDNKNDRWPDNLAARLSTNTPTAGVGLINQGIGGNSVVSGGLGPTLLARFDRDGPGQSGVRWLIVFEGVNDIGGSTSASSLITAYQLFATKAHARNLLIYGATITPFGGNSYYTPAHEATRQTVNSWIKTNNLYDAVLDFDLVARDPGATTNLNPAFNSGDGLHLNPAGYQALANSIDLTLFTQ